VYARFIPDFPGLILSEQEIKSVRLASKEINRIIDLPTLLRKKLCIKLVFHPFLLYLLVYINYTPPRRLGYLCDSYYPKRKRKFNDHF